MLQTPFYDPEKSYDENYEQGPFGELADGRAIEREGKPNQQFLGEPVYVPFGIPAGPLVNSTYCAAAFAKGFDLCVYKTVRTREYPCHPAPNIIAVETGGDLTLEKMAAGLQAKASGYSEPLSITNSFGVPSKPVDEWQVDMEKAVQSAGNGQVLIGSFQGTKTEGGSVDDFVDDYVLAARLVKETGAKILEANLSCPNEGTGNLVCFDLDRVEHIATAIKNEIGDTPLLLKLAYFEQESQLELLVQRIGDVVQGLSTINTMPSRIYKIDGTQALPGEGRLVSGVCGAGVQWAGLEMVQRLVDLRAKFGYSFVIVGVGGVMAPEDYHRYRAAGADAVMSATGAMWRPTLAEEISQSMQTQQGAI
ncbi:dihydroorotate oxidase [Candidatus Woesebacteria bacterium]|nr:dihydroorotate oxidase [Candidatus Woesebacteria bacterium]